MAWDCPWTSHVQTHLHSKHKPKPRVLALPPDFFQYIGFKDCWAAKPGNGC